MEVKGGGAYEPPPELVIFTAEPCSGYSLCDLVGPKVSLEPEMQRQYSPPPANHCDVVHVMMFM